MAFSYALFFLSGLFYYLFTKNRKQQPHADRYLRKTTFKISLVSFFILLAAALLLLSGYLYTKDILFYVFMSLMAGIIALQIFTIKTIDDRLFLFILSMEIMPLALIIRGSSFLINPNLIGPDVPWHFHYVNGIINNGALSIDAYYYFFYPAYHLLQSLGNLLLDFNQNSYNIINLATSSATVIIFAAIGREIFNNRAGLVSALLLTISTMHVFSAIFNTSKIGGIVLLFLCIYIVLRSYRKKSGLMSIIFWIAAFSILIWHPEISFVLFLVLLGNSIALILANRRFLVDFNSIIFIISCIVYMIYSKSDVFNKIIISLLERDGPNLIQNLQAMSNLSIYFVGQLFLAYIGIVFFIFIIAYFIMDILYKQKISNQFAFLLCAFVLLHLSPLFSLFSDNFGFSPDRTLLYISLFSIIISSGIILEIFKTHTRKSTAALAVIVVLFTFFSLVSYMIGDGNLILNNEIPKETIFTTESNLATYNFLNLTPHNSTLIGDYDSLRYTTDPTRGFYNLPDRNLYGNTIGFSVLSSAITDEYVIINQPNLERLNWKAFAWSGNLTNYTSKAQFVYNNGNLNIYH